MKPHSAKLLPLEAPSKETSQTRRRAPRVLELQEVVVTGIGVVLPGCDDSSVFWQQLSQGQTQLSIEPDPAQQMPCAIGRVRNFDPARYLRRFQASKYRSCHREQLLYLASIAQAAESAGFDLDGETQHEIGLFDGTSRGSFAFWYDTLRQRLENRGSALTLKEISRGMPGQAVGVAAAMFGLTGPTYTFNGTCASGVIAIGNAYRELQTGRVEMAFATGHDAALVEPMFEMYRDAGLLSEESADASFAISPYSLHGGNAFGEGAVSLVLETRAHAERRGANVLAEICGFRHGNGGQHPTEVDFSGDRPAEVIEDILAEAETTERSIDFVLGHGNGVRGSDISELNYMKQVFGDRCRHVPLISTKPVYGHTLGASGALNAAAATLMLLNDYVIPTVGIDERKAVRGFNHQANVGVSRRLNSGLVVALGIGGQNAALMLRKG
jgi:3-oxoacyl-[acyl-carrier-protein] synthase II